MNKADLCPHHYSLQKQARLPEHLEKIRMRKKAKMIADYYQNKEGKQ